MAFDPTKYKPRGIKKLPVLLLLDVSGSMRGEKIINLHDAVVEMINSYVEMKKRERVIEVAIITFGNSVDLYKKYTSVDELQKEGIPQFNANGGTPLGMALQMAKDLMEDPDETPRGNYAPAVVLVSDGEPNDEWRGPLDAFIHSGRTQKAQRFAVAIGVEADKKMLREFARSDDAMFYAENARELAEAFKTISTQSARAPKAESSMKTAPARESAPAEVPQTKVSLADDDSADPWMGGE